jgi:hypothetical protein
VLRDRLLRRLRVQHGDEAVRRVPGQLPGVHVQLRKPGVQRVRGQVRGQRRRQRMRRYVYVHVYVYVTSWSTLRLCLRYV